MYDSVVIDFCLFSFFEIESLNTFEIGYILVSLDIYIPMPNLHEP